MRVEKEVKVKVGKEDEVRIREEIKAEKEV